MKLIFAIVSCVVLAACDRNNFEDGSGSAFAEVSRDQNDQCRVFVTDMGRASPPVKPFVANIEGCKSESKK